ncbi:MAG: hypothetical protein AAB263_18250 [Planctomycetota bacterium]
MSDPVSATITHALDHVAEQPTQVSTDELEAALAAAASRREALARSGVRVAESPYVHFLRRFAAESVPPTLAQSA